MFITEEKAYLIAQNTWLRFSLMPHHCFLCLKWEMTLEGGFLATVRLAQFFRDRGCKAHGEFLFVECDFPVASFRLPPPSPLASCTVGRLRRFLFHPLDVLKRKERRACRVWCICAGPSSFYLESWPPWWFLPLCP